MNDRTTATAARFGISEQTAAPGSTDPLLPENLTKKKNVRVIWTLFFVAVHSWYTAQSLAACKHTVFS